MASCKHLAVNFAGQSGFLGVMKDILLCHYFILLILLCVHISHSALKDIGVFRQNRPVKDVFDQRNHHKHFDKDKTSVQNHHAPDSLQVSASVYHETSGENTFAKDEDEMKEGLDHSTLSGEGSSSFEIEHSSYVEQKNEDSSTKGKTVINERSGSGSGYLNRTEATEKKLKELIEDEEIGTEKARTEQQSSSFVEKEDANDLSPTTIYANTSKLGTLTKENLILKRTEVVKPNTTSVYPEEVKTDVTTLEKMKNKTRPTVFVQKPTSFLSVLREIKQQLNELLKWKQEHERNVHEVAMVIGKAFIQGNSYTESQADKNHYWEHSRKKRSNNEKENTLSKEISRKIENNFPCRHPETMVLIKGGSSFFNEPDCSQCKCHMAKLTCKKDLEKCYPNACHLLNGEIIPNLAIHNDGCNNCLCHSGQLICTRVRCPEAGNHYTNYKDNGLKTVEPENLSKDVATEKPIRSPDACLECDRLPGPYVCGRKQWKTFPSLCHAIFCGKNQDDDIKEHSCETLDPCASSPCGKGQRCVAYYRAPCIAGDNTTTLCRQYKCLSQDVNCSKQQTNAEVCGTDGKSYSNECEMFSKGVRLAYEGPCKKNCHSEVCGIESRTFASYCHSAEMKAYVDYRGPCEYHFTAPLIQETKTGETSFKNERCDLVYEHGRCAPAKCDKAVLPPGACCPVCGAALVVSLNLKRLNKDTASVRLDQIYELVTNLQDEVLPKLCKISIDLSYTMDILIVVMPYKTNELEACGTMASEMVDKINYLRDGNETGTQAILGAATLIKEKPFERMDDDEDLV